MLDATFNRIADQLHHLVASGDERDITVSALNFPPLLTRLDAKARSVLAERLVQQADNDESPLRASTFLCEVLEEVNVSTTCGCGLEELAHLIDEQQHAVETSSFSQCDEVVDDQTRRMRCSRL